MACKLAPDATGAFDFTAGVGASATIFVESTPAGVKMSAADVAGTDCHSGRQAPDADVDVCRTRGSPRCSVCQVLSAAIAECSRSGKLNASALSD